MFLLVLHHSLTTKFENEPYIASLSTFKKISVCPFFVPGAVSGTHSKIPERGAQRAPKKFEVPERGAERTPTRRSAERTPDKTWSGTNTEKK